MVPSLLECCYDVKMSPVCIAMSLRSKDPWFLLLDTADLMLDVPIVALAKLFIRFGFEPLAWPPPLGY